MSREEVLKDYEQYKAAGRVWGPGICGLHPKDQLSTT
jgi:hypothetical protein